jgi:iron complex outermembrane recepter protein
MFQTFAKRGRAALICGAAAAALACGQPALAAPKPLTIPPQPLAAALRQVANASGVDVLFSPDAVRDLRSSAVTEAPTARDAVEAMVRGTGLEVVQGANGALIVRPRAGQPAPGSAAPSDGADEALTAAQVSEIIVTANKRDERLRDVPSAVTAFSGADLRRAQALRLEDYATKVPGLNIISSGEGTTQLVLRGITTGSAQASSTVAVYIDDTPYNGSTVFAGAATGVPDLDPSDLDHIEVLKGPQGTLYGADALGGVLKFVTVRPDATRFSGRIDAGGAWVDGGGSGYNASAAVNIPLVTDQLAVRISGFDRQDPGYINDPSRGVSNINTATVAGGRIAFLWTPTDHLTFTLSALGQDLKADNPSSEDVAAPSLKPLTGDRDQTRLFDSPKSYSYRVYSGGATLDLGGVSLISSTSYSTFRLSRSEDIPSYDAAFAAEGIAFHLLQPVTDDKFTQEVRLQSASSDTLEWRVGAFYTDERSVQSQHIDELLRPSFTPVGVLADVRVPDRYTEAAAFGDVTYHFTSQFDVTVGGRYSHNNQHSDEVGTLSGAPINAPLSTSDSSTTWLINPRYKLDDETMIYARAASAYRPGGPTTQVPGFVGPNSFAPDSLIDYEAGLKGVYFDRRLTLDVAAFYIDWKKIQLNEDVNNFTFITNGGKAHSTGLESSATLTPLSGLNLTAAATYTDAALDQDALGAGGRNGDQLPGTPRWNWSLDANYEWAVATGWTAFAGGSYRHVGDRPSDFALEGNGAVAPRYQLPAYDVVDLRIGASRGPWTLTAYVKNVGDSRGLLSIAPLTLEPSASPYQAAIIQPRTFGLDLSTTF